MPWAKALNLFPLDPYKSRMDAITSTRTIVFGLLLFATASAIAQKGGKDEPIYLSVNGTIKASDKKLEGCKVVIFIGNDSIGEVITPKSGKFHFGMEKDQEYGLVFKCNGYVPKRIIVDTHAKLTKEIFAEMNLDMIVNMMEAEKFEGANTDALDFPFAILKYDRKANAFLEDPEYTTGVMRTNGALLLVAGRSTNK